MTSTSTGELKQELKQLKGMYTTLAFLPEKDLDKLVVFIKNWTLKIIDECTDDHGCCVAKDVLTKLKEL